MSILLSMAIKIDFRQKFNYFFDELQSKSVYLTIKSYIIEHPISAY